MTMILFWLMIIDFTSYQKKNIVTCVTCGTIALLVKCWAWPKQKRSLNFFPLSRVHATISITRSTELSKIANSKMETFLSPLCFKKSNYVIRVFSINGEAGTDPLFDGVIDIAPNLLCISLDISLSNHSSITHFYSSSVEKASMPVS